MTRSTAGRPPKYETAQELQDAIDDYINNPPMRMVGSKDEVREVPAITIAGLCYQLGFASRQSFYDNESRGEDFAWTVQRARLFIESAYEEKLSHPACTGSIFALKNLGWSDKSEMEMSGTLGIKEMFKDKSDEELERELKDIKIDE